ncbi:ABC transporter permease [Anaerococcus tetradius]|uniref:ABC transporter permease n=1 Tax=Anaerococcus tetradius TaxID=33036 RepID=UPI0023EF5D97|nr:ABC transporter permease [Anaerococcus tetradius]
MILLELFILCAVFFILCFVGTGTDEKNLKNYMSYPDQVQEAISRIGEYQGKYKERGKFAIFFGNFIFFTFLFFLLALTFRSRDFTDNFLSLLILGEGLNLFDLLIIDLLWWRNTKRIRFSKIPDKSLYQDPKKHIASFLRALVMYFLVALVDGYLLTLF